MQPSFRILIKILMCYSATLKRSSPRFVAPRPIHHGQVTSSLTAKWWNGKKTQQIVEFAKWLRRNHFAGPVKDSDLDAHAVIAIAIIFAILNDGRIVARTGQKEIESLIRRARETKLDINVGWYNLLKNTPTEYQPILLERIKNIQDTIIKKILSKAKVNAVVTEIQDYYASTEVDIDYA